MWKKARISILLLLLVGLIVCSFVPTAQARVDTILWNTILKGQLTSAGATPYKYHYFPISAGDTQTFEIGGGADPLKSLGLGLEGEGETGANTGYVRLTEDADILRFRFHMPETFVDTGTQQDLLLEFYLDEQVTIDAATFDINVYEFNNTTPIITDELTIKNGDTAAWTGLVTNSAGIGNETDLDADDILVITVSPVTRTPYADGHYTNIYGCRIRYRPGIETTEELE
jgi:hypothetical protein